MPERKANGGVLLEERLKAAIARLNPNIPEEARHDALLAALAMGSSSLIEENRRLHQSLCDGVPVEYSSEDGTIRGDAVRLLDFDDPAAHDWLAINQFAVVEGGKSRRPDVVMFVNGLPLAVFELKNPGAENATVQDAFNQLQTYKAEIPSLFRSNAFLVISDGASARIGSLTADYDRFALAHDRRL